MEMRINGVLGKALNKLILIYHTQALEVIYHQGIKKKEVTIIDLLNLKILKSPNP